METIQATFSVKAIREHHEKLKRQENYGYIESLECKHKEFLLSQLDKALEVISMQVTAQKTLVELASETLRS